MISLLCVDRTVPVFAETEDGNGSDKTINNKILSHISKYMANHGIEQGAFIYIADSAMVTAQNPLSDDCLNRSFCHRKHRSKTEKRPIFDLKACQLGILLDPTPMLALRKHVSRRCGHIDSRIHIYDYFVLYIIYKVIY